MIVHSTGQVSVELLNITSVRVDVMNKTPEDQTVHILIWDTTTSPKQVVFNETFTVSPSNGDSRTFTPLTFPDQYEVVVRTNTTRIVPYISGISTEGVTNPSVTFKYGDLFVEEYPGTV